MANVKEIQDRIKSVNDTMKITNAMYMISSNKLRKAKKSLEDTEPYFRAVNSMIGRVIRHLPEDMHDIYLEDNNLPEWTEKTVGYIVVTDDKGLAGAFNHNVLKMTERAMAKNKHNKLYVVGEVGRNYFMRKDVEVAEEFRYTAQNPTMGRARALSSYVIDDFLNHKIDELYIVYTEMKNSLVSETNMERLLPLARHNQEAIRQSEAIINDSTELNLREYFLMDPSPKAVLDNIVPNLVVGYIYGALVESYCSVQNSRMIAMDSANKNAKEMIHDLSMSYNRERQAMITQEITEVASGAKALRHAKEMLAKQRAAREEALRKEEEEGKRI